MKRILCYLLLFSLTAVFLAACAEESSVFDTSNPENAEESVYEADIVSETITPDGISETISKDTESIPNADISDISSDIDTDNIYNLSYGITYKTWSEFAESEYNYLNYLKTKDIESVSGPTLPDFSKVESVLDVQNIWYCDALQFYTSSCAISVYPLLTEEDESRTPYWASSWMFSKYPLNVITNVDEYNALEQGYKNSTILKYTKEGIDIYLLQIIDSGFLNYELAFRIGDYWFCIYAPQTFRYHVDGKEIYDLNKTEEFPVFPEIPSKAMFEKAKPLFEDKMALYEINYIYDEKSELVRILKEAIEKAEQGDHVTE